MKKFISTILCFTLIVFLVLSNDIAVSAKTKGSQLLCGITIDCSNRYYSVEYIKKYIKLVSVNPNGYVQLHLTGDRNVGIECEYLGQIANEKYKKNGNEYYNVKTGKSFLTKAQIRYIISYAIKKKVRIVPEIDMPGHMEGFKALYKKMYGSKNINEIFNREYDGELLINNSKAIKFAKNIYREYSKLFAKCKYFHMGCDEFWSGKAKDNAKYINTISKYLNEKGFTVWIWNDLFRKTNVNSINHKLFVCYWSIDGDTQNKAKKKFRRKQRSTFPELQQKGFKVLNYNSYYLYFTPSKKNINKTDVKYMINDAKKNWNIKVWDGNNRKVAKQSKRIVGACVSIWGEDSKGVSNKSIYCSANGLYKVVAKKCKNK